MWNWTGWSEVSLEITFERGFVQERQKSDLVTTPRMEESGAPHHHLGSRIYRRSTSFILLLRQNPERRVLGCDCVHGECHFFRDATSEGGNTDFDRFRPCPCSVWLEGLSTCKLLKPFT